MPSFVKPPSLIVHGASSLGDPLTALHEALVVLGQALASYGATPADVVTLTWTARQPAAIHPSRAVVDLALRENFGGGRPPIALRSADHAGVKIEADVRPPSPPSDKPVWRDFTLAQLTRAYSPRATVQNMPAIFDTWRRDGTAFRDRHLTAELRYGAAAAELIDLYLPANPRGPLPLWIFIHGGYWQAVDKQHNAQFATGLLSAGYAVAMPNYTLAPEASLAGIVEQTQRAITFLASEAPALGCDPAELHLSGHSAGGHLAAMIASLPEGRLIRSCLPLSGLFDLEPLSHLSMGSLLDFNTPSRIATLSPARLTPQPHVRVGVAVGGAESAEFQRQSTEFAQLWRDSPCRIIPGRNHFDLLDGLNGGALLRFALDIARLGP